MTTNAPWNDEAKRDREQFAEVGANVVGALQREIDRVDPATDPRAIYGLCRDHIIDLTARWIQAMQQADEYDAVLFGASPGVLLRALRSHLTLGQLAQLTDMLRDGPE
jgi:hypothetical protein